MKIEDFRFKLNQLIEVTNLVLDTDIILNPLRLNEKWILVESLCIK